MCTVLCCLRPGKNFQKPICNRYHNIASSRLVYYSIFNCFGGASNQDLQLTKNCYYYHVHFSKINSLYSFILLEFICTEGCSGQSSNPGPALDVLVQWFGFVELNQLFSLTSYQFRIFFKLCMLKNSRCTFNEGISMYTSTRTHFSHSYV